MGVHAADHLRSAADDPESIQPDDHKQKAFDNLNLSVAAALAAADPAPDEQIRIVSDIYGKSRAFIAALARLAADPIGPLKKGLSDLVDQITKLAQIDFKIWARSTFDKWINGLFEAGVFDPFIDLNLEAPSVPVGYRSLILQFLLQTWKNTVLTFPGGNDLRDARVLSTELIAGYLQSMKDLAEYPGFANTNSDFNKLNEDEKKVFKTILDNINKKLTVLGDRAPVIIEGSVGFSLLQLAVYLDQIRRLASQPQGLPNVISEIAARTEAALEAAKPLLEIRVIADLPKKTSDLIGVMLADTTGLPADLSTVDGCLDAAVELLKTVHESFEAVPPEIRDDLVAFQERLAEFRNEKSSVPVPSGDPIRDARERLTKAVASAWRSGSWRRPAAATAMRTAASRGSRC